MLNCLRASCLRPTRRRSLDGSVLGIDRKDRPTLNAGAVSLIHEAAHYFLTESACIGTSLGKVPIEHQGTKATNTWDVGLN